jgi:hypothetical protein
MNSDITVANRKQLAPTNFITHVNNIPTPDVSTFLCEVKKVGDDEYFRLKVTSFDNVPWVATMKKDEHYFPTLEYLKDAEEPLGWKKIIHGCDAKDVR